MPGSSSGGCADVLLVGARGSGERGPGTPGWRAASSDPYGLGPTVSSAYRRLAADLAAHRTIGVASVRYAANSVVRLFDDPPDYFANLSKGVSWTKSYLARRAAACPAQQIVLAGFSQGAMVMHRVLHQLGGTASGRRILSRLADAILVGDGDQVPHDNAVTRYGTAPLGARGAGLALRTLSHSSTARFSRGVGSRVLSVCNRQDIVCDWTDLNLRRCSYHPTCWKRLVKIHLSYPGTKPLLSAADRAARDVRAVPLPTPGTVRLAATTGTAIRYQLVADVEPGYALQWALSPAAAMPAGLALSAGGVVSGKPGKSGSFITAIRVRSVRSGRYSRWVPATLKVTVAPRSAWAAVQAPLPSNADPADGGSLTGVACPSAVSCTAVGSYTDSSADSQGLIASGAYAQPGAWAAAEAPLPANADPADGNGAALYPVACPSSSYCAAAGIYTGTDVPDPYYGSGYTDAMVLSGSGSSWTPAQIKPPPGTDLAYIEDNAPTSVACSSATYCVVAGGYQMNDGFYSWLARGPGSAWTASNAPVPSGAPSGTETFLNKVACGTSACLAAGWYLDSSGHAQGLLVWISGSAVTAVRAPLPGNALASPQVYFNSASCSASQCVAVGTYSASDGTDGLIVSGSGTSWTAARAPVPAGTGETTLESADCPPAGSCLAVGAYDESVGSPLPLLLTGSGSTWTAERVPLPAGASSTEAALLGVACPSATGCVISGSYDFSGGAWQGMMLSGASGSWSPARMPLPAGADPPQLTYLTGVTALTCHSASECVVVGSYPMSSGTGGLIVTGPG